MAIVKRCPRCGSTDLRTRGDVAGGISFVCNACGYESPVDIPRKGGTL